MKAVKDEQNLWVPKNSAVNFINVIRTNFSYECRFSSFFYIHITAEMTFVRKIRAFDVDEIGTRLKNIGIKMSHKEITFFKGL